VKTNQQQKTSVYGELPGLLFEMRQIIRHTINGGDKADPHEWMHVQTLAFIATHGSPTMIEVAKYLRIKAPSATSLVSNLVLRGHVLRKAGTDRRAVHLSVTSKGLEELKNHHERTERSMRTVFSALPKAEVCVFRDLLQKMISCHGKKIKNNN
jgi:DNA-binding MarR family transcriptional regulator